MEEKRVLGSAIIQLEHAARATSDDAALRQSRKAVDRAINDFGDAVGWKWVGIGLVVGAILGGCAGVAVGRLSAGQ